MATVTEWDRQGSADRGKNWSIEVEAARAVRDIVVALGKAKGEDTRSEVVVGGEDGDNPAMEVCLAKAEVLGDRIRDRHHTERDSEKGEEVATAAVDVGAVAVEALEVPLAVRGRRCPTC